MELMHATVIDFRFIVLPALVDAMQDPRLRGHAREIYAWLYFKRLNADTFTPVKLAAVEYAKRVNRRTAIDALRKLTRTGYIECRTFGRGRSYRLVKANPLAVHDPRAGDQASRPDAVA